MPVISKVMTAVLLLSAATSLKAQQVLNPQQALHHPESIISDGHFYYITDMGLQLDPTSKDGDGVIWKMSPDGHFNNDAVFVKGLHAPKGTAICKGVLFVTDIDHVLGFDLATGKKKYDIDFTPAQTAFLNDLAIKDDHTLFVSAMDINAIFTIHISAKPSFEK